MQKTISSERMNGYTLMAESCRRLIEQRPETRTEMESYIRIYEFLGSCDKDDLCKLVDSTAFNSIIRAYVKTAMNHAGIDECSKDKVMLELAWLYDCKLAKEVLEEASKKN